MPLRGVFDFPGRSCWRPAADVYRGPFGWLVKLEVAGVRLEDVSVQLAGSRLSISGQRRDLVIQEGCTQYSMELSYNRFERMIELPGNLDRARLELELRNGILLVRIDTEDHGRA